MERLVGLMEAVDISKTQLAAELGVGDVTVHRWMLGKNAPSDRRKRDLARYFGVSVDWLMGWDDDDLPEE